MKNKELIKKLKELPADADVVLFDWRKNLFHNDGFGDASGEGVYEKFEIRTEDFVRADNEDEDIEVIVLSFENEDYTTDGHITNIFKERLVEESKK